MEDNRENKASKTAEQSSYELTELKQHSRGLRGSAPGPLFIYYSFSLVLMGRLNRWTSGHLIFVPSLGVLLFFSFPALIWWFLLYFLFFSYALLLPLQSLFFPNERQKGNASWLKSRWGGTRGWGTVGGKAIVRIQCITKNLCLVEKEKNYLPQYSFLMLIFNNYLCYPGGFLTPLAHSSLRQNWKNSRNN